MLCGLVVMLVVRIATAVSWQWYVLIGSMVTFAAGYLAALLARTQIAAPVREAAPSE